MLKLQLPVSYYSLLLACALSACGEATTSPVRESSPQFDPLSGAPLRSNEPVQTDSVVYHLTRVPGGYDAWASATYVNRTGRSVYYARCTSNHNGPMFYVYRALPDTSMHFVGWGWACVGGVPTGELAAGDSLTVRVWLGSLDQPHAQPPVTMEQRVGLLRVVLQLCASYNDDSDFCRALPLVDRRSNVFRVLPP
jgi:hypothetical protein